MTFPSTPLPVMIELSLDGVWTDITQYVFDRDASSIQIQRGRSSEAGQTERGTARFTLNNADGRFSPRNPTGPYYGLIGRNTPLRASIDGHWRFHGEVSEWPVSWDASGNDVYTTVEASGILRRLGQGASPLRSALYRTITSTTPTAYWPIEDAEGSTQAASGVAGGSPLKKSGAVDFAASDGPPGSAPIAEQTSAGRMFGVVPPGTSSSSWRIEYVAKFPQDNPASLGTEGPVWKTAGTVSAWEVGFLPVGIGGATLSYLTAAGSAVSLDTFADVRDGQWHHIRVDAEQSGANISILVDFDGVNVLTDVIASETLGRITSVTVNPVVTDDSLLPYSIGHLAVWAPWNAALSDQLVLDAFAGHAGETAGRRIERLCDEEGLPIAAIGDLDDTEPMGAQSVATLLTLVQECVDADVGILYEPRDALGLGYRTRASLYNQAAQVELNYTAEHLSGPLNPVDDDQLTHNDVTATRKGGSSARVEVTDGPMSVQDPPDGVRRYDDAITVNIEDDERLPDHAGWHTHLGTVDEARYPELEVNLASTPVASDSSLVTALLDFDFGDRVTVDNPPAWLPPEQISQLAQGYTETMRQFEHRMTLNCSPESPYRVGVLDDTTLGRATTTGSTLAAAIGSVSTVAFVADTEVNNTTAGTSCVVGVPAGTRREDVMVALIGKVDQAAVTPPAGWTLIGSQLAGSNVIYEAYYRVAQPSEPATYTWSWGVAAKNIGWIGTYRNVNIAAPVAASASTGSNVAGTAFSTPVPASVPAGCRVIRSVFERHPFTGATNTWTISSSGGNERMDVGSNGGSGQDDSSAVYDNSIAPAGVPTARTVTASQTVNQVAMWTIALAPASQMDISVSTTSGPVWTYLGLSLPFDITIAGEVMTVDLIGDVLNTNPYFGVDLTDWSVQNATSIARSTAVVHPSAVASMLITPNGVAANGGAQAALSGTGTVTAGRSYIAAGWVNIPTGYSDVRMAVDWYDSAGVLLSSGLGPQYNVAAAVWTPITATLVAPASASQGRLRVRLASTPPATALTYVWNAQFVDVTDSSTSPQRMRVTRNVNGVVKSQSSGAAVQLTHPMNLAL